MDKPMLCPMSFSGRVIYHINSDDDNGFYLHEPMECTPDCAWAVYTPGNNYGCSIAHAAVSYIGYTNDEWFGISARPLPEVEE